MAVVKGKVSLNCKPNQTWFYGCVRYTDQSFLSPSAKEKHALEKELYVPCYFRKISKAALLKEKRAQLWNHFLLFKIFYSRKKKQKGMRKKKKKSVLCFWLVPGIQHPTRSVGWRRVPDPDRSSPRAKRPQPSPHNHPLVGGGWRLPRTRWQHRRTAPASGRLFASWSKAARREEGRPC